MKQGWLDVSPKTFPRQDCPVIKKSAILQLDTKQSESQFKDEDRETGVKKRGGKVHGCCPVNVLIFDFIICSISLYPRSQIAA